ncbi:MAG: hypothetical protein Q9160_004954 [Pyrenula sp. 1 TL-2023]
MSTQYDDIGSRFQTMKQIPIVALEEANLRAALPSSFTDKTVLDLACGTGRYAELLISWGAQRAVGLDISSEMVSVAREISSKAGMQGKIEYRVQDCAKPMGPILDSGERFDLVTGSWFLNYASNYAELLAMFQNVSANLKSSVHPDGGGIFVGIVPNPLDAPPIGQRFGIHAERIAKVEDGYRIRVTTIDSHASGEAPIVFENYQLREEVYLKAAKEAGMVDVEFKIPNIIPEGWKEPYEGYLDGIGEVPGWRQAPNFAVLVARKG